MPEYMDGMYYALLEGRFLFDFVHEDRMQLERLKKYSALILPNTALLSDEQCQQLRDYVQQGGGLLATLESSMYTEQNERRADFGLADVFGVHAAGPAIGRIGNSNPFYARIEKPHPLVEGFHNTSILPGSEYRVPLAPVDSPVLTVVPDSLLTHRSSPIRGNHSLWNRRLYYSRTSRDVWSFFPETSSAPCGLRETLTSAVLQNAIRWVSGNSAPVSIEGRGFIEAFAWETEPGFAVHVLN